MSYFSKRNINKTYDILKDTLGKSKIGWNNGCLPLFQKFFHYFTMAWCLVLMVEGT
jgi:hypothetical protein